MISNQTLSVILRYSLLLFIFVAVTPSSEAATLIATNTVASKSFYLGESTSTAGYKVYFNTYDGIATYSRSRTVYSGETLNFQNGVYNFVSDYDVYFPGQTPYDGPYSPIGYGTISIAIPTTDSDGDGLIDFLDPTMAFKGTLNGSITEFITSKGLKTYPTTCYFNRGANSSVAEFTFTTSAAKITGFSHLYTGRTKVTYDTDAKTITFAGVGLGYGSTFNPGDFGTASSTYEILSSTSIRVNAFTYVNSYQTKYVNSFILNRTGNKFVATGTMQDGDPYSSWVDYKDFVLTITDNNDTDGDGVPDLSDSLLFYGPVITQEPQGINVIQGNNTNLSVTATSPFEMTYQWYLNDVALEGKTGSTLTFTNIQPIAAGNYRVVITSNGKSKNGQTVVLGVYVPPSFSTSPQAATLVAGKPLSITVNASGTPAPTFEWYHDNTLIPNITGATLTINTTSLSDAGVYYAKAINAAGTNNSQTARIIVTTGIFSKPVSTTKEFIQSSGFPLDLQLENGKSYRIEYSTDLVNWTTLTTFTSSGTAKQFLDANAAANEKRFYRLVTQ